MSTRHNALGRGLDALIPSAPQLSRVEPRRVDAAGGLSELPVDEIDPNPEQPRRHFDPEQLAQLADSLRRHGVLQPVVVRRAGERFELVVGERRWRAAVAAGLATIPCVISDSTPGDRLELALVENVQRRDLNPIELAHAYRALASAGATQQEIGERVGMDRSSVANCLRLLELSREIQEDVETNRLSMGHAKALMQVQGPERQRHLRDQIVREGLSVREAERRGRVAAGPAPKRAERRERSPGDPELVRLADQLRQRFQTRVRVRGGVERGRIELEFYGSEDLDRIARLLLEGR